MGAVGVQVFVRWSCYNFGYEVGNRTLYFLGAEDPDTIVTGKKAELLDFLNISFVFLGPWCGYRRGMKNQFKLSWFSRNCSLMKESKLKKFIGRVFHQTT